MTDPKPQCVEEDLTVITRQKLPMPQSEYDEGHDLTDYVDLGELLGGGDPINELQVIPDGEGACPGCGIRVGRYYGPINFNGEKHHLGDYVCRQCAVDRGVEVTG